MFQYGNKVVIRDRSSLDGVEGIVYRVEEERISVLLDREVIWHVAPDCLELHFPVRGPESSS